MINLGFLIKVVKKLYERSLKDEVSAMSAQISYHLLLSFFPFLIFVVTLFGYTSLTGEKMLNELGLVMPEATHRLIMNVMGEITAKRNGTLLSFGVISALWIASRGFTAVIKGINKAYGCAETRPFWKVKGLGILCTIGVALLILFSFVMLVFGEPIGHYIFDIIGCPLIFMHIWRYARYAISIATLMFVLATLYYILPNKRLRIPEVLPGTLCSSALWIIISVGFSFYVNNYNNYSGLYGSIGGIIILLIWLYLSSMIILLGGELNAVLSSIKQL